MMRAGVTDLARTVEKEYNLILKYKLRVMKGRTVDIGGVGLEGNEDIRWRYTMLFGNPRDDLVGQKGRIVWAKRRVGRDHDAFCSTSFEDIVLKARTV